MVRVIDTGSFGEDPKHSPTDNTEWYNKDNHKSQNMYRICCYVINRVHVIIFNQGYMFSWNELNTWILLLLHSLNLELYIHLFHLDMLAPLLYFLLLAAYIFIVVAGPNCDFNPWLWHFSCVVVAFTLLSLLPCLIFIMGAPLVWGCRITTTVGHPWWVSSKGAMRATQRLPLHMKSAIVRD